MRLEKSELVGLRLTPPFLKACEAAAAKSGMTVPDWMRAALTRAAESAGTWGAAGYVEQVKRPRKRSGRGKR